MRLVLNFVLYAFTFAVIAAVSGGFWLYNEYKKPGPLENEIIFHVERGQSTSTIAKNLKEENVISNDFVFLFGLKYIDPNSFLKAGEYKLSPKITMTEVIAELQTGRTIQYKFTIPECATSYEAYNLINAIDGLEGTLARPPEEGTLFPDTYNFVRGEQRIDVIRRLQKKMDMTLEAAWRTKTRTDLPFKTPKDALILASIVEKEAGKAEERPKVAGLFINRLNKGMRLQSDPTVIYGIVDGKPKTDGKGPLGRRILKKDLEFDSPYNTYIYTGLTPTPICNPGKASIEAVLNPENHDYIYMVADGTGGHAFGKTLREHNNNVRKWRKIRDAQ